MTVRLARTLILAPIFWLLAAGGEARPPVEAHHGMVVSARAEASRAGVEMLQAGGNAIDAAVATEFALAVVYPSAGNLGGGGFMLVRFADGRTTAIDYRETAPAAAHRDLYLGPDGKVVPGLSEQGHLSVGVPGSVAGMLYAHERFGRLSLAQVMGPAVKLAAEGWELSPGEAALLNEHASEFAKHEGARRYFTKPEEGATFAAGDRLVQSDLAATLRRIRDRGRDGFYRGETADLIVAEMKRGGGLITHQDLAEYQPVERAPVSGTYRGYTVYSMPPPSSGGIALLQILNAVEPHAFGAGGFHSVADIHLAGEAMRRAYADRARWLGDPDFVGVPQQRLISKEYMNQRMRSFEPGAVTPSAEVAPGNPGSAEENPETTHYSVVDAEGNAVSTTTTLNGSYGSHVAVVGAGFLLNNEMDDFSAKPGVPNRYGLVGGEANAIAPGKRMLSSMSPTIVADPQGRLFLVAGSPGGSTIITTVFQVITNVIDHKMDIQQAVAAPRFHHQWLPDVLQYEIHGLDPATREALQQIGWKLETRAPYGRADGIQIRIAGAERTLLGGADPRGEDAAVGH